ncbi:hypothetical protein ACFFUB_10915 [Algimonas porphyrae]|uniref:Uncharacterized protein n=1 Tax=Algimonas porphyrae TaxID=1128113 RepID=A0ABQ5V2S1_9PROT|nr:hypothetical protein [Algimonas porphyrae]GLQ21372.1 hypothetical protein GCM10007854_23270 [Algimonas porphyrae]
MTHMMKMLAAGVMAMAVMIPMTAQAETLPSRDRTVVMLHVIADKGQACGLLDQWEAMVIKVQARQERRDWDTARRQRADRAIAADMAEKSCDDDMVTVWIDAARPNLSSEGLAPFLVVYQNLAKRDRPPDSFDATTMRIDYTDAIERIEAEFERLEVEGRVAEGGKAWDEYRAGLTVFIDEAVDAMEQGEQAQSRKAREAITYMSVAATIVEVWLRETDVNRQD